jgi:hypothetical protein
MENGKCEMKQKRNENVFCRPQSLFILKRNCSARAVEPASYIIGLLFICTHCIFGAVWFCDSVLVFPKFEELSVS